MGLFFKTEYKGNYNTLHFHFQQLEVKKGPKKRSNEQINNIILLIPVKLRVKTILVMVQIFFGFIFFEPV